MPNLRYRVNVKMDITVDDKDYPNKTINNKDTKPLGDTIVLTGTADQIKTKIGKSLDKSIGKLLELYYGEE